MSYAKLIHDFLDEGLSSPEEDSLFAELNRNAELRNEFNQQVKMHVITQNDMASIAPPLATTAAVFSALGFSVPVAPVSVPIAKPSGEARFKAMLGKYLPTVIAIFISAAITAFMVVMLSDSKDNIEFAEKANTNIARLGLPSSGIASSGNSAYPVITSSDQGVPPRVNNPIVNYGRGTDDAREVINTPTSPVEKWIPRVSPAETELAIAENNEFNNIERKNISENGTYASIFAKDKRDVFSQDFLNTQDGLSDITRYEFLARAANGAFFDVGGIYPQISPKFASSSILDNKSIGVLYRLSDNFVVGVELGKEIYNQEFTFQEKGITRVQKQSPSLFWYGATLRYTPVDLIENDMFYPYIQATLGGTNIGLLAKAQAGISLDILKNMGVNLGYEFSGIQYTVDDIMKFSSKHGLTIGLTYKLK